MKKIILDTNFLLIPFALKVDIFEEIDNIMDDKYELYIIDKTVAELNKIIENQKGKHKRAAKFALQILKKKPINIIKTVSKDSVDEELITLSKDYIIATQDKALKAELKGKIIVLRQKSHLVLI